MENAKNPLIPIKEKEKKSLKDYRQRVNVDLIPLEPLHTYYNNIFSLQIYT
jgi:hypothetical protein